MGKISLKWVAVFSVATNLLMIVPPMHMLQVYNRVLTSNSLETLIYITLMAIVAIMLFGVAESVRGYLGQRAAARYTVQTADPLFARLADRTDGSASSYLRDFNNVRTFIPSRAMMSLFDLPFTPLFLLLMFMIHWSLGMFTLVGFVVLGVIAVVNKMVTSAPSSEARETDGQALNFAQTVFSRSEDIRAMGLLPAVMDRWGHKMASSLVSSDNAARQTNSFQGMSKAVRKILQISIMAWGAYLVLQGQMSGGVIFAATMISGRALQPFEQFIGSWDRISQARAANKNINELMKTPVSSADAVKLPDPKGSILVDKLTYAPSTLANARPVLDGVSFGISAGKTLAIIGPSGAGKSTVAKAIVGAIEVDSGLVQLDGAERSQWPEEQWGQTVGYVSQEVVMFPGTLSENIARLEMQPDNQRVVAAAQAAGIHDMIVALPDGYGTELGPGKVLLSGGQKQRLALARALYTDPKVLVLDEPNAHLDKQGEKLLMDALRRAKKEGRTVIIVTQRRNILDIADAVLTIRNGRVDSYVTSEQAKARAEKARQNLKPPKLDVSDAQGIPVPQGSVPEGPDLQGKEEVAHETV